MKKVSAFVLAFLTALSLSGCTPSDEELQSPSNVSVQDSSSANTSESTEAPETQAPSKATISETVLVDDMGVKITAKGLAPDGIFGADVKLLIENNSGKNLTFQCRNTSVNGYMIESMLSEDVADGKKSNCDLTFMSSDLEMCGIEEIADIELSFHIFTTEDWADYLNTEQISLKTSAAEGYEYTFDDSGSVAYENGGIKITVKGLSEGGSIFGEDVVVYISNGSERPITVQASDISVNGFMIDGIFSCDVMPGKHAIDAVTLMSDDLEANGITDIETIELYFNIMDAETWDTIVDTDIVSITF